jgi:hypothetical protein
MSNGLLTLFDPDLFPDGNVNTAAPGIFFDSNNASISSPSTGAFAGGKVLSGDVRLPARAVNGFFAASLFAAGSWRAGLSDRPGSFVVGTAAAYVTGTTTSTNAPQLVVFRSNNVNSVGFNLDPVPGAPIVSGPALHIEARVSYSVVDAGSVTFTAQVWYNGVLSFERTVSNVVFASADLSILLPYLFATRMRDIVSYDTSIRSAPLGITKVRKVLTNSSALNPPPNDGTFVTVFPAGANFNLASTDLGNVLAGGLVIRATPNTQGEVSELVATVRSADLSKQEAFSTGTLPLFSVGSYYFPLTQFSGADLFGGRLNLKSLEPEA